MTVPQFLQQRIRAKKDISDGESVSNSEAQGTASETESASEVGLPHENAANLEEDTSDKEVGITTIPFNDLSESSRNPPHLPRLSITTHQAYPSALLPAHRKPSENATVLYPKNLLSQNVYALLMTARTRPLILAKFHCQPVPQNTPQQPNPRNTPSPAAVKSSQYPKSCPAIPASILLLGPWTVTASPRPTPSFPITSLPR